jgi:hypothetical protein
MRTLQVVMRIRQKTFSSQEGMNFLCLRRRLWKKRVALRTERVRKMGMKQAQMGMSVCRVGRPPMRAGD